jgi:hypothetical protein
MKHILFGAAVTAFLAMAALSAPTAAKAQSIGLTVAPTRLVLSDAQRAGGAIMVSNRSDSLMRFRVELRRAHETDPDPASWLKAAPRSMLLGPGESQTIRMLAQAPAGFHGEQRAYAVFAPVPVVDDASTSSAAGGSGAGASISFLTSPVIPVILRVGITGEPEITVDPAVRVSPEGYLTATIHRPEGQPAVSSHGDLTICDASGPVAQITSTTLWPEVASRVYTLSPIRAPAGQLTPIWTPKVSGAPPAKPCQIR